MSTQNVTVGVHYLPLCSASLCLSLVLSVEGFFTLTLRRGGPHSTIGLACALEWLSAMWVAVTDPGIVSAALAVTWGSMLPYTGVIKLVFVVTSRFYVYLALLVVRLKSFVQQHF